MENNIFVIDREGNLRTMQRSAFESEDLFQELLGKHPALLGSASGANGKLLLITREQPVPEELGGSGRWSLDHLFIDNEAVPVLVEVKRATDTRARREVVAQMLDYAANGIAYWPVKDLIAAFNSTTTEDGKDPRKVLASFLGKGDDEVDAASEAFWKQVEANLRAGRIRMLFVADKIHKELARIVEFLNEQMRPAEVLALELEHFCDGSDVRTIVPRLIGDTERAQSAKSVESTDTEPFSKEESFRQLEARFGDDAKKGVERIINWFEERGYPYSPNGNRSIAFCVQLPDGRLCWPVLIRWTNGRVEIAVWNLRKVEFYAEQATRQALVKKIQAALGATRTLKITDKSFDGVPSIEARDLARDDIWAGFLVIIEEIIRNILAR